ncbi:MULTISPECIES: metallophosphoesterase [Streptomyces]|uniref:metallophosphoesterase n=1 Tax=Streptomyces TaxID=1883 RepID=UPI0004BD9354|nr:MULTISPECIES: metallophosphoesterase [Streptomyces]KOU19764.1 membrane protein [Streptomyces sp. WM6349]KOU86971.1 membrane protein [Streptomyces sp. XY593]KOV00191.1 membrane protein [Streptomyces sp. XY533]KOV45784.1 membrane protein [Streptomyces sp. H036]MCI4082055.1 metallophosphoesterase [Streptomyces sp. MMS21 TC-5]
MLGIGLWALMLAGSGVVHRYLWIRLVRDTTGPRTTARRLATSGVVLSALLAPATRMLTPLFDPSDGGGGRFLAWPGYTLIGVLLYLLLALAVLELPRALILRRWRRSAGQQAGAAPVRVPVTAAAVPEAATPPAPAAAEPAPDAPGEEDQRLLGRRLFLGRAVGTVAGVTALGTVGYGMSSALGDPLVRRVPVTLSKVNPRLSGLRIAVVSDIHLGPLLGRAHTERIVRMVNGLQADLVTIVGDLADGTASQLGPAARPLKALESRYGNFFVTGNHEYLYDGVEDWLDEMRNVGVRPLVNERVEIRHNGAHLDLAGVEDLAGEEFGRGPDLGRALGGRDLSRPVVLLAHQPVFADEAARHGVDLQLSGHTHGGQMFPLTAVTSLVNPVNSGLGRVEDTQVYVTNGAGFFGPPVRVGAPAEITLLELRSPLPV